MIELDRPAVYDFDRYAIGVSGSQLKSTILRTIHDRIHWRDDSGRIEGGKRRPFVPLPHNLIDRMLLSGNPEFRGVMSLCAAVADRVMGEAGFKDWKTNRLVVNYMPPYAELHTHDDPSTYKDGVVVVGFGKAAFEYGDAGETIATDEASLLVVPSGLSHSVANLSDERISIAAVHDVRFADGQSVFGQVVERGLNRLTHR